MALIKIKQIAGLSTDLSTLTSADLSLETKISTDILAANVDLSSDIQAVADDLATEISDREAGDATLSTNLSAEVVRATGVEDAISSDLATEISDRESGDATLSTNLSAEVVRATGVEDGLDSRISTLEDTIMADIEEDEVVLQGNASLSLDFSVAHPIQDDNADLVKAFVNGVKVEVGSVNGTTVSLIDPGYDIDDNDTVVIFYQWS